MLKKIIFTIFNILFFINSSAQIKKNKKFDLGPILANNDSEILKLKDDQDLDSYIKNI